MKSLIELAGDLMQMGAPGEEPGYRFLHGMRTAHLADELARREGLRDHIRTDALFLAGLFHDVGKCTASSESDHAEAGADRVRFLLRGKLEPEGIDVVQRAIRWHNKREHYPDDLPVEGLLLQDADLLDHFGATEIWLISYRVAARGGGAKDFLADYREAASWRRYALRSLHYPESRKEIRARMRVGAHFHRQLARETMCIEGELICESIPGNAFWTERP